MHVQSLSNFPYTCSCFLMSQCLMSGSKKGKKRKMKGRKKGADPLIPLEVTWQGGVQQQWLLASSPAPLWSELRSLTFGRQEALCPPWFPQAVCKPLQKHAHSCLQRGWWVRNEQLWHWPKLTTIYLPRLPLEFSILQWTTEFQSSYSKSSLDIVNRLCDSKWTDI